VKNEEAHILCTKSLLGFGIDVFDNKAYFYVGLSPTFCI
jgi:hypothetical protein